MSEYRMRERRRRTLLWTAVAVLTVLVLALSVWVMGPAPPTQIVMATGARAGSFQPYGDQYRARLENMGLRVELVPTHGSVDNLKRLVEGEVDVAFVHGGAQGCVEDPEGVLRGLVTIHLQPVWVFYRASQPARTPSDFAGRTVAVGPAGSGSEAVAKQVLKAHGVTEQNARFDNVAFEDADRAFADGKIDAAMLLGASDNAMILALLKRSELALMDFASQGMAHTRHFPY
jgi:TRAP transporter TAXI family solute receptor